METALKDIQAAEQRARETVAEARRLAAEHLEQAEVKTARLAAACRQEWEQYQQAQAAEQARLQAKQTEEQAEQLAEETKRLRQRMTRLKPALRTSLLNQLMDEAWNRGD
ncbi:hypothetical protein HCH52_06415 [Oscillospiraceae bacterium HV4-5-C5C]|nr:hypothetical protein [Oscillospiraceae bacterium HV4-5-C5C]